MAVSRQEPAAGQQPAQPARMSNSTSVAELVGEILDKGIVIDVWARVSVVGLELLTIEARVVVASVETYLRYAEVIGLTATAAPPPGQQVASGGEQQQEGEGRHLSEDEVLRSIREHPKGLQLEAMQTLLEAPREQLGEIVHHLVEEHKVRRDEEHKLYLPNQE